MEIVKEILLVLHIIGFAGIFGGWFMQLKAIGRGEGTIYPGMVHSGWLAGAAGVLMFGINEMLYDMTMSLRIKILVKLIVLCVIMFLMIKNKKKSVVPAGAMWAIGGLTVLDICIAILWH